MSDFLDTQACSYTINEIIKTAKKEIYILSPYLRFSQLIFDRLDYATKRGVTVNVIYGKTELHVQEFEKLKSLNINLFFKENLHAKCYANDFIALIGSMNLHQYSEFHNEEMGIRITQTQDSKAFKACCDQINFILNTSTVVHQMASVNKNPYTFQYEIFKEKWHKDLVNRYTNSIFVEVENYIKGENAVLPNIHITTQYGFLTIDIPYNKDTCRNLKNTFEPDLSKLLCDYRFYWSSPYDRIFLYHKKNHIADSLEEDLEYCRVGEKLLVDFIKKVIPSLKFNNPIDSWIPSRRNLN